MAETAGRTGIQQALERLETLGDKVLHPIGANVVVSATELLNPGDDAQVAHRMNLHCDRMGEYPDAGAPSSIVRQKPGLRSSLVQVLGDGKRLRQAQPIYVQHRDQSLRIAGEMVVASLLTAWEIYRDRSVGDSGEIERDPDAIAGGRAPVIEQHCLG